MLIVVSLRQSANSVGPKQLKPSSSKDASQCSNVNSILGKKPLNIIFERSLTHKFFAAILSKLSSIFKWFKCSQVHCSNSTLPFAGSSTFSLYSGLKLMARGSSPLFVPSGVLNYNNTICLISEKFTGVLARQLVSQAAVVGSDCVYSQFAQVHICQNVSKYIIKVRIPPRFV